MSQQPQQAGHVSVSMKSIIDMLHQKYGRLVAGLMQENAETQAALEAVSGERDELAQRLAIQLTQNGGEPKMADPLRGRVFGGPGAGDNPQA